MKELFHYKNVFFDSSSDYAIEKINERNYIEKLFSLLERFLLENFNRFNFYVLFSHNPNAIPASSTIAGKNKVLFWFSEESGLIPLNLCNDYTLIFKSYIKCEQFNIYSTPLGYMNEIEHFNLERIKRKDIVIFFSGNLNYGRRELYELFFFKKYWMFQFLKKFPLSFSRLFFFRLNISNLSIKKNKSYIFFSKGFKSGFSYPAYLDYLARSRFVICPKGFHSNETFRHLEALKCGCIVVSEPLPDVSIYKDNPFIIFNSSVELNLILKRIENGEYDQEDLQKKHSLFYKTTLDVKAVALKLSHICSTVL